MNPAARIVLDIYAILRKESMYNKLLFYPLGDKADMNFIYFLLTHTQVNKHTHTTHQGRWNPKEKRRKIIFPKWKLWKGEYIFCLKLHYKYSINLFLLSFLWLHMVTNLPWRVKEEQHVCKIENWKYLNRCLIF